LISSSFFASGPLVDSTGLFPFFFCNHACTDALRFFLPFARAFPEGSLCPLIRAARASGSPIFFGCFLPLAFFFIFLPISDFLLPPLLPYPFACVDSCSLTSVPPLCVCSAFVREDILFHLVFWFFFSIYPVRAVLPFALPAGSCFTKRFFCRPAIRSPSFPSCSHFRPRKWPVPLGGFFYP